MIEGTGALFDCLATQLINTRFRAYVVGQANVPSTRPVGSEFDLGYCTLSLKFARENIGSLNARSQIVSNNTTRPVGDRQLTIDLGFGPGGSGTGVSLTRSNGSNIPTTPNPATDLTTVDETIVVNNPRGSITLDAAPGDVVPITLDRIHLQTTDEEGFTYPVTCIPVGDPLFLGEVTASGHTLAVEPGGPVREGDDVSLVSTVEPYTTGQVEFRDGDTTIGVAPVVDGVARMTTSTLPNGVRNLTAIFTGGLLIPALASNTVALDVVVIDCSPLETGNGAVVRLVYMELLLRGPDPAGYSHWKGRLDGGLSAEAFASVISRSREAVGQVVNDAYQTVLGRNAETTGKAFWVDRLQAGGRYDQLLADLAASGEFWGLSGGTNEGFVTRVYEQLLHRAPDPAGLDYWVEKLEAGVSPRALVRTLANLDEPLGVLVADSYGEILDRAPTAGERAEGISGLRSTGDRSGLYAQLIGRTEFANRAQDFPNLT